MHDRLMASTKCSRCIAQWRSCSMSLLTMLQHYAECCCWHDSVASHHQSLADEMCCASRTLCFCCSERLPMTEFGKLPTVDDYRLVCKPPPPPPPSPAAKEQHLQQAPAPSTAESTTGTASTIPQAAPAPATAPAAVSTSSAKSGPSIQQKAGPTLTALIIPPSQVGTHITVA